MELQIYSNVDKLISKIKGDITKYNAFMSTLMRKTAYMVMGRVDLSIAKGEYGIKTRGGRLRGGLNIDVKENGNEILGIIGNAGVEYARVHEFGWTDEKTGKVRMPKREYMSKAIKAEKEKVLRTFQKAIMEEYK